MKHTIINRDVIEGLKMLPDAYVQCVVTSPPYYGLRDYGHENQIGLEATPDEYIAKLVDVFREVRRVLRDDGTVWLNIGDSYANGGGADIKPKDLIGIPWTLAFALRADGWYLRQDIIWHKPNPMPESVTDRCTKAHEYIFLLSKSQKYYYDSEAVKEKGIYPEGTKAAKGSIERSSTYKVNSRPPEYKIYDGVRNKRSVWSINTHSYKEAHFATFPEALVEPCIKAGTSEYGCCAACGAPMVRKVHRKPPGKHDSEYQTVASGRGATGDRSKHAEPSEVTTIGWQPSCTCDVDTIPCTVLDPFSGSGTVAKVARDLGRSSVGIELNTEYVTLQKKRLHIGQQLDTGVIEYVVIGSD